jgi:molecular chaperone DnaJ
MAEDDFYKILGVEKGATRDQIRSAYKKLAKKYHPDNKDTGDTERFKKINEAASVLGDDKKRQHYDQFGSADPYQGAGQQGFNGFDFRNFGGDFESGDFGDIFDHLGDIFGGSFGAGGRRGRRRQRGEDLAYDVSITLEEAAFGAKKTISFDHITTCPDCDGTGAEKGSDLAECPDCKGTGRVRRTQRTPFGIIQTAGVCPKCQGQGEIIETECSKCDGTGVVKGKKKLDINIPAGIDDDMRLRVEGHGDASPRGGETGDMYILVHVLPHKYFTRKDDDIYVDYPISVSQAALGTDIEVPTLTGKATLRIPPGTQPDTMFRMKGKGIKGLRSGDEGDEYVKVKVKIPENLSKTQKKLFEELDDESKKSGFFKNLFNW